VLLEQNELKPKNRCPYFGSIFGAQADSLAWTYDKNDNTLTASNVNGTYTFTPDAANFVTSQTDPFAKTLTFTPDADYNVTQIADSV
jgi:YD repeat-containing protein